jgi:hypothetical protein
VSRDLNRSIVKVMEAIDALIIRQERAISYADRIGNVIDERLADVTDDGEA